MPKAALPENRMYLNRKTLVLILLTIFVVVLTGVLAWFETKEFKDVILARNQEQLQYIAQSEARHLEDSFNDIISLLEIFSTSPIIQKTFKENIRGSEISQNDYHASEEILRRLNWIADSVYRIDSQGVVLERAPFKEEREGSDYSNKPGIASVLKHHKTHISEIFLTKSGAPAVTICVPVLEENSLIGILRALLYLHTLEEIVGHIRIGENGYTQILNSSGNVIFHPDHAYIGKNIMAMKKEKFPAIDWSELEATVKHMSAGDDGVAVYQSARQTGAKPAALNEITAFTSITISNQLWSINVTMDEAEITTLIDRHTINTFGVAAIAILLFIAGSTIIYNVQKKKDRLEMSIRSAEVLERTNQKLQREVEERKVLEEKSKQKGDYLKTIMESLTHPFYVIDAETYTIRLANSAARKNGITEASTCHSLTHRRDTPCESVEHPCPLKETKKTKKPVTVEHVHYDRDGNPKTFLVHGFPIFDDQGSVIQMIEYSLDITDKKKAEEELEKTKDNLDNIIESSLDPIVIVDITGSITRVNESFLKVLGYTEEEVIGKHTTEFSPSVEGSYESTTGNTIEITEDLIKQSKVMLAKLVEEGRVYNWERYFIRKDQKVVPVESNIVFLYDKQGNMTGGVGILRDITERKKAEEESSEARNFLENIFETTADGIMVTDEQGCIVKINKAIEQMLGYREDELVGKYTSELGTQDEERVKTRAIIFEQLFEKGYVKHWETEWYRKDGSLCPIEINITFLKDSKGNLYRSVAGIRDISDRKQAEESLQESEEQLRSLVQSASDGILTINSRGEIQSWNNGAHAIFGYTPEEIIGKSFSCLVPERHREDNKKSMEKMIVTDKACFGGKTFSFPGIRKDGSEFPAEISYASYEAKEGIVLTGIVRDITERQKAEQEIREARSFLENIFRTVTDGILVTDNTGTITVVNEATASMLAYSKEEMIGQGAHIFKPEGEDYELVANNYVEQLFEEETVTGFEFVWLKKDGSLIDVEVNAALLKDNDGTVTGAVSTIRDITERKEFEEKLKKSEDKYRGLIKNANDAIITVNMEGVIIDYNEMAEKMFGYSSDEILGKPGSLLTPVAEREKWEKSIKQFKDNPALSLPSSTREKKGLRKDGKEIFLESSTFSLKTHGEYIFTSIIRDITERKEIEYKLLQSEKLKSLGELAGGVAHDFNNVLAAILGRAQLLKINLSVPTGKQEKRKSVCEINNGLAIIEKAAMDGAETVRRIQEFARKRTDDKDFVLVNINELLEHALEFTRVKWKDETESKGIGIHIQKEFSSLPPTLGSASELREVFTNIINNAVDAMPLGGELSIKTVNDNKQVMITINDTGIGIPKSTQDRIFDPFFTTKGVQSTGLGMSVSYGIINRHRGTIKVSSIEGAGTTFTVTLPLSEKVTKDVERVALQQKKQKKASILVIEDENEVRKLLTDILLSGGEHEVESVSDGSQGIELFKRKSSDIVFTDLGMPGMSGWEVAEAVKSINKKVPVIIITGWSVDLQESEMKGRGVDLIAYKPFEVNQVLELVQEGMEIKEKFRAA
jgi:PAS domain S-box-containing protein